MRSTQESRVHCNSYPSDGREPFFWCDCIQSDAKRNPQEHSGFSVLPESTFVPAIWFDQKVHLISTFNSDKPFTLAGNSLVLVIIPELDGW